MISSTAMSIKAGEMSSSLSRLGFVSSMIASIMVLQPLRRSVSSPRFLGADSDVMSRSVANFIW